MKTFFPVLVAITLAMLASCTAQPSCQSTSCQSASYQSDQRITAAVQAAMERYDALKFDHLLVETRDGIVYVRGMVDTQNEYALVSEIAIKTPGVKEVINMTVMVRSSRG